MDTEEKQLFRTLNENLAFLAKQLQRIGQHLEKEPSEAPAETQDEPTQFRRMFWSFYAGQYPEDGVQPGYGASSFWVEITEPRLTIAMSLAQDAIYLWVRGRRGEKTDDVLPRLRPYAQRLRDELGVEIGGGDYLALKREAIQTRSDANWSVMAGWFHEQITAYRRVLKSPPAS